MSKGPIHPRGFWLHEGGHKYDKMLAAGIAELLDSLDIVTVIDIGCGDGSYAKYLHNAGFKIIGYDGNPLTPSLDGLCHVADFSEPQDFGKFDAVVSIEVGEHIPVEYEANFLGNLDRHASKVIVLSWAVPGQGGHGHVNERENGYIVIAMAELDWMIDWPKTDFLRDRVSDCFWLQNTLMVFSR